MDGHPIRICRPWYELLAASFYTMAWIAVAFVISGVFVGEELGGPQKPQILTCEALRHEWLCFLFVHTLH